MNPISAEATRWLAGYLATGDSTPESRVFRAARQAGHDHRDIRQAARVLGVEMFPGSRTAWWRLASPPSGSALVPAPMSPPIPETHGRPRPEADGAI
jgi:hypothetical protein